MKIACAVEYVRRLGDRKPWLVLGKGPTLDRLGAVPAAAYHVLTLSGAVEQADPAVAFFMDYEAYVRGRAFMRASPVRPHVKPPAVCLPWYPHFRHRPDGRTLVDALVGAGLTGFAPDPDSPIITFNSTTAPRGSARNPQVKTVRVRHFSGVGAFNLLARAGVKAIHSLGVDGGTAYASCFDRRPLLANGRDTFDHQFAEIARTVTANNIKWKRL